jgi:ribosomal protection tetracycline resistance protein
MSMAPSSRSSAARAGRRSPTCACARERCARATRLRYGDGDEGKVTAIDVFDRGAAVRRAVVAAGQIAKLRGLSNVRIGDAIGDRATNGAHRRHFAPPTLETVVVARRPDDARALHAALGQLAEQDPLIALRQDPLRGELSVSLYGEVQKEVVQATLAEDFGIDVAFRATTTICLERPIGTGAAVEFNGKDPNPFLATVGLRVEPAPLGAGIRFGLDVELGSMPYAFFKAVEETVHETLQQGLHGWRVADCAVTMTHSGYSARQSHAHATFDKSMSSTAADFRGLTPLVLMSALRRAGTRVHEPVHRFHLEVPAGALGAVLPALAALDAIPEAPALRGSTCALEGEIPAARVHALRTRLPALARGEGVLETEFHRHRPMRGAIASRPRTDHDPLDREAYLRHVRR